jgi:hypothetical protein
MVVWFLTDNNTTPTKVVLSYFGLLVGLWQFGSAELMFGLLCLVKFGLRGSHFSSSLLEVP